MLLDKSPKSSIILLEFLFLSNIDAKLGFSSKLK